MPQKRKQTEEETEEFSEVIDMPDGEMEEILPAPDGRTYVPLVSNNISLIADSLDDIEGIRKALGNRYYAAVRNTRTKRRGDPHEGPFTGPITGLGLFDDHPIASLLADTVFDLGEVGLSRPQFEEKTKMPVYDEAGNHVHKKHRNKYSIENRLIKTLEKEVHETAFSEFISRRENVGLGAKQVARLLAAMGDPYLRNDPIRETKGKDEGAILHHRYVPRTMSQLIGYSGLGNDHNGQPRRRHRGMPAEDALRVGKSVIKMRAWNVATSLQIIASKNPESAYYEVFHRARQKHTDAVHQQFCPQCAGAQKAGSGEVGSQLQPGHVKARILREVSREVVKNLYLFARSVHDPQLHAQAEADHAAATEQLAA